MNKEILIFGDNEIDNRNFHNSKYLIDINNVDIDKIMISNKFFLGNKGHKYFIGYKDANKVKPLCVTPT